MANFSVDLSPLFKVYDWWTGIQKQKQADAALADVAKLAQQGDVVTQQKTDAQPAWTPQAPTEDFLSASLMQQQPQIPQVPTPQQYNVTETRTPYQQSPEYKAALWKLAQFNPSIAKQLVMPDNELKNVDMGGNVGFVNSRGELVRSYPKTPEPIKPLHPIVEQEKQANIKKTEVETENLLNPKAKPAYQIGKRETFQSGTNNVVMEVKGFDAKGNPVWEPVKGLGGPRDKTGTTVNVSNVQESAFQKEVGQELGKQYSGMQKAARDARQSNDKLTRLEQLAAKVRTGKLAPAAITLGAYADAFGINIKGIPEAQAAQTITNELALEIRNTAEGTGMPGQMSDADREFLIASTGNLSMTSEGLRKTIDIKKKLNQRRIDTAKLANAYVQKNKTLDGFEQFMSQWSNENPLFVDKHGRPPLSSFSKKGG